MMKLKERPRSTKRRRRTARGTHPTVHAVPTPMPHPAPRACSGRSRRMTCESDEALSIALDRMIDEILRQRPNP